jgi:hypothetical protein
MSMARKMSDAQLAEVLQGKSLDVPQYVAMTEAMGRKQLRTAMQGQQAQQQAQQPNLKNKLLGEYQQAQQPQMPPQGMPQGMPPQQPVMAAEGGLMYADGGSIDMNESANAGGGLAELPAPNMMPMTMAGGGIVAFDEGGEVPRFNEGGNFFTNFRDSLYSPEERRLEAMKRGRATDEPTDTLSENQVNSILRGKTPGPAEAPMPAASMQKEIDDSKMRLFKQEMADKEAATNAKPVFTGPTQAQRNAFYEKSNTGAPNEKAGLGATDEFKSYMDNLKKERADSMAELKGLSAKSREAALAAKSQGGGEALMAIARGLVSKPGLAAGVGEGLPGVIAASAASRKEQNALNQSANDYDLNIAKSREAAAKGDMEAALQYKKLAQDAQYQQGMLAYHNASLNKPGESMQLLQALGDPEMMKRYKEMQAGKKGELYSIDKAVDDFNAAIKDKFSDEAKRLKALNITNPYQYQQYVLSQSGGGGNPFQSGAIAEAQKRGI